MKLDAHVHIVGNGSKATGCRMKLHGRYRLMARFMLYQFGLPQEVLFQNLDRAYVEKLANYVRESSLDKAVILAMDEVYDQKGRIMEGVSTIYVPNDYVLRLAKEYPEFLPAVSIHPARVDAMDELLKAIEEGAV